MAATSWWDVNIPEKLETFKQWLGDSNMPDRVMCRNHVIGCNYKSILDVGCGVGVDGIGYRPYSQITYQGVDRTQALVDYCRSHDIPAVQGDVENLPFDDDGFDVVYTRHTLEHLAYYEEAILELIRVAKREVLVIFFIQPTEQEDFINDTPMPDVGKIGDIPLYHNRYNRAKLAWFILQQPKVDSIRWVDCLLHIKLKTP